METDVQRFELRLKTTVSEIPSTYETRTRSVAFLTPHPAGEWVRWEAYIALKKQLEGQKKGEQS